MSTQRKWKHPISSGTYSSWRAMLGRCLKPTDAGYARYGAIGATVCSEWIHSFDSFYECMGERPPGFTLDRIDNAIGYTPENCRWASRVDQLKNRKVTITITHDGKTMTMVEWAEHLRVPYRILYSRIRILGLSPEKALTADRLIPPRRHGTNSMYAGGCRCSQCVAAGIQYRKEARAKRYEQRT